MVTIPSPEEDTDNILTLLYQYDVTYKGHISAWREAVSCKARLTGSGTPFARDATPQMTASPVPQGGS